MLLAALPCACINWTPDYREIDLGSVPLEDAWNEFARVVESDGLRVDEATTDRGRRVLQTHWRTRAMPFRGSVRRRVYAEFEPSADERSWLVRFYVERQTVNDIGKGFEPEEDDWEEWGQDVEFEQRLAAKLTLRFHGRMPGAAPAPR